MTQAWSNWSGSLRFVPGSLVDPVSEEDVATLVQLAAERGQNVRVVGTGHSSSPLVETPDLLVSLKNLRGLADHDVGRCEATLFAGTPLGEAGESLAEFGMTFFNLGDVDYQTIAGAIGTGTHGTGLTLQSLSAHLVGGTMVTGNGDTVSFSIDEDPNLVRACRVSLGALGVLTRVRLRLIPAFQLRKRKWCAKTDDCLAAFGDLAEALRHVDFYWYPRSDEVQIRTMDLAQNAAVELPYARLCEEEVGWSHEIIPNARELRFEEMEYALPFEEGIPCFEAVRRRIKERWRQSVGWRVLYRTIAADDVYLSTAHGRETVTISLHQNNTLPYQDFFADIEPIFREHAGRPHWGKKHSLWADQLRPLYPAWDEFLSVRQRTDPGGVFLNAYLRRLLGVDDRDESATVRA